LASGLAGRRAGERLEIRGGADVRGQVGSERRRKGRGLTHGPELAATEKEERGVGPRWLCGPEEESRPAGKKRLGRARTSWAGRKKKKKGGRKGGGPAGAVLGRGESWAAARKERMKGEK
jgi:hypothetical protein